MSISEADGAIPELIVCSIKDNRPKAGKALSGFRSERSYIRRAYERDQPIDRLGCEGEVGQWLSVFRPNPLTAPGSEQAASGFNDVVIEAEQPGPPHEAQVAIVLSFIDHPESIPVDFPLMKIEGQPRIRHFPRWRNPSHRRFDY